MMKHRVLGVLLFLIPTLALATPAKIEMVFLSPQKISMLLEQLDKMNTLKTSKKIAQNEDPEHANCVPMGDGCFNPQYGYIEKKEAPKPDPKILADKKETDQIELKNFNSLDTSLVNCDKNNYFDIFCGKEKAGSAPSEIEIWFDVSSSLRTVDYNKDPDQCLRRAFMEKVMDNCKSKVSVSVYNTSIKQIGDHSGVCMSYGTNDESRLISWMKNSKAKHLLIVTDIDEMSLEMRSFLESNGAKMTGDGVKAFTAKDLVDYASVFTKMCR
jgi:hypothetical protein